MIMGLFTKMVYLQTHTIIDKSHYGHASYRGLIDILHPMLITTLWGWRNRSCHTCLDSPDTLFITVEDAASCLLMSMVWGEGWVGTITGPYKYSPQWSALVFMVSRCHFCLGFSKHFPHNLNILVPTSLYVVMKLQKSSTWRKQSTNA